MRRVWVRGHDNVRKRVLLQAAACNIGLLLAPADRRWYAPKPAGAGFVGDLRSDRALAGLLGAPEAGVGAETVHASS